MILFADFFHNERKNVKRLAAGALRARAPGSLQALQDDKRVNMENPSNIYRPDPLRALPRTGGFGLFWLQIRKHGTKVVLKFVLLTHQAQKAGETTGPPRRPFLQRDLLGCPFFEVKSIQNPGSTWRCPFSWQSLRTKVIKNNQKSRRVVSKCSSTSLWT